MFLIERSDRLRELARIHPPEAIHSGHGPSARIDASSGST